MEYQNQSQKSRDHKHYPKSLLVLLILGNGLNRKTILQTSFCHLSYIQSHLSGQQDAWNFCVLKSFTILFE